ncbi:MAG: hypothetical protein ACREBQ_06860, partial [Nitrososphaerales archaeon]
SKGPVLEKRRCQGRFEGKEFLILMGFENKCECSRKKKRYQDSKKRWWYQTPKKKSKELYSDQELTFARLKGESPAQQQKGS